MTQPASLSDRKNIVILTGAGISKESGLDTFRDADGLWSKVRLEDVATPEAFQRDPELVHGFYNARRQTLLNEAIQPNAAHRALAELEDRWSGDVLLVTQNIDGLHNRAGSRNVLPMHGELLSALCQTCGQRCAWQEDLTTQTPCPHCGQKGGMRVDVVWFGEMPYQMERIYQALEDCDLFLSIGTSGTVYPAAGFVQELRAIGRAHCLELNLEPSDGATLFHEARYGPASQLVPDFVSELLESA
ncbi:NAD-dependent deacylase [Rhodovibrionaceae bacterium A322]